MASGLVTLVISLSIGLMLGFLSGYLTAMILVARDKAIIKLNADETVVNSAAFSLLLQSAPRALKARLAAQENKKNGKTDTEDEDDQVFETPEQQTKS